MSMTTRPAADSKLPESQDPDIEHSASKVAVAAALFAQPQLGISRIIYVGLPEREAVHVALAASGRGLRPRLARRPAAQASVQLEPPGACEPPAEDAVSNAERWQRLVGAVRRLGRLGRGGDR
jgi:hypothetical protein